MAREWTQLSAVVQQAIGGGLANFVLNSLPASGGYLPWPASEDGKVTYYFAQNLAGNEREVGSGVYTHATRIIERTTIYQSTNNDQKVNFSQAPLVVATWGGELFRRVDEVLDITDGGTVQDALVALGIENVDNTPDADKPISTATQTALDGKEPLIGAKNTAFNKSFAGSGATDDVARADHDHAGVYALVGHDHTGIYALVGHDHTGIYEPAGTVLTHSGGEDGAAAHVSASDRTTWDSAGTDSHTHANKALLDTYTQTNTDLAAAVVHKDAVDPHVTLSQKADWDSKAEGVHTHLLANITDSGSAAALDAGTAIGNVVTLANVGGNPGLPAVDGSQLTGITSGTFLHADLTDTTTDGHPGTVITIAAGVQGNAVSIAANGSLQDAGVPPGGAGGATDLSITTRTGTTFTIESSSGQDAVAPAASITEAGLLSAADKTSIDGLGTAASLDVGTTVGDIVQLVDVGGSPGMPAVDGSQLTGIAGGSGNNWLTANSGSNFTNPPSANGTNAIALGDNAVGDQTDALVIGMDASVSALRGTAIGRSATAAAVAVAVGPNTAAQANGSSFGSAARSGSAAVALGVGATSEFDSAIAIGDGADATALRGIAIGRTASAAADAIATGSSAAASLSNSVAIGNGARAQADTRIVIGQYSGEAGVAIVLLTPNGSLRVLTNGTVETSSDGGTNWAAVGGGSANNWLMCYGGADFATTPVATDTGTIALGDAANVGGNSHAIAIGTSATATAGSCVTIGRSSTVSGAAGVAIGWSASVGDYAVAVGSNTTATSGNGSVALGYQCTTGTDTRISIGLTAQAEAGTSILVRTAVGALRVLTDGTVESSSNGGGSWAAVGGGGSTLHADLTDTATDGHPGSAITIGGGVQGNAVAIGASGELVDAGTPPGGSDELVAVSATDTTPSFLQSKLTSGDASVTFSRTSPGGNEQLDIRATGAGGGEANAGVNLGIGSEVYAGKNGVNLEFRTIDDSSNIVWTQTANLLTAEVPADTFDPFGLASTVQGNLDFHTGDATIHFTQGAISIPASQISDFDTEVANNTAVAANTTKLAGIEDGATADQTAAEIKTAYESNADTNEFSDLEKLKLLTVENGATIDQSPAEIKSAYESNANTNAFTDAEQTKVSNALTSTGSIDTHTDVDTTTAAPINGQVLEWNGSNWVPATSSTGVTDHTLLSNIGTNTHAQIDTHIADATVHFTQGAISIPASQISDFDTEVANNTAVTANTAKVSASGSIDTHSDVDTTTAAPNTGDTLEWDGAAWIPATPAGGITMYIQGTAPTGASDGDFWIDNS